MKLPASPKRCLAIAMLRVVDLRQKDTARYTRCANQIVVDVEEWFREEEYYHRVARICNDQSIKKMVAAEAIYWGVEEETLVKLDRLTQDDILRHYRTDYMKAEELDIESVVTQLKSQLFLPAPETVRIDDFGGHGHHIIRFRQDIFKVVSKIGYNTGEFWVSKEDWRPSSEIPADLEINYIVSPFGTLELFCPVEEHPLFQKLLSKTAQEKFSIWKKESGRYLIMCRDIYRKIYAEARTRTFQSAWETVKIGPQPLTPNFADLIYLLAILHRRSPGQFPIPDENLYQIKPRGLFVSELYLGLIHLADAPEPPPIPPPPSNIFLNGYINTHRDMIGNWSASLDITELLKLFEALRGIGEAIQQELMTDHPAQQDSPLVR